MGSAREGFRWGDADEDDDGMETMLPPRQVMGPDEKGIKIVIEWRIDDQGRKIKTTKTLRVKKQLRKLKPEVIRRSQLKKFGDATGQIGTDNYTMVSTEEIFLERPDVSGENKEEASKGGELASLGNATLMVCRICGKKGDHWTSKCPFKELVASRGGGAGVFGDKFEDDVPSGGAGGGGAASGAGKAGGAYVPPSMRGGGTRESAGDSGGRGGSSRSTRDDNSIRVTNLSEDTKQADLQELFGTFGPISRVYVASDKDTGLSRGFAFINFVNREDAVRAISKLNGYGYDNLILRVEWATPRADKPAS